MKLKIAIVRGAFLNQYEMQFYEPLVRDFDITAFASLKPMHDRFRFPVVKLPSPMDLPDFPYKMPILNRIFTDAHYLFGLEQRLTGFDIVHSAETYYHYTQQALNAKSQGRVKKVIATVLENIPFNNEGIWGRKAFKKRARSQLDHLIALTNLTREVLIREGTDPAKISVISHFIDTRKFSPTPEQKKQIANPDQKDLTILFCGRLETYKGIFDILDAAQILVNDKSLQKFSLTFKFVGQGSQRNALLEKITSTGLRSRVLISDVAYEQMPGVYQAAHIFVAPSQETSTWQEQYNTALLEAQATGLAIVANRTGGIPENVGDAVVLVRPGDVESLARSVKAFILNPKLRLEYARRARLRAESVHDISIGALKLSRLYLKLLS